MNKQTNKRTHNFRWQFLLVYTTTVFFHSLSLPTWYFLISLVTRYYYYFYIFFRISYLCSQPATPFSFYHFFFVYFASNWTHAIFFRGYTIHHSVAIISILHCLLAYCCICIYVFNVCVCDCVQVHTNVLNPLCVCVCVFCIRFSHVIYLAKSQKWNTIKPKNISHAISNVMWDTTGAWGAFHCTHTTHIVFVLCMLVST